MNGTSFEIRAGRRLVSLQNASTPREAVVEYLRSMGSRDAEITAVAADALAWGGAVYRAVPLGTEVTDESEPSRGRGERRQ
jgi:hypothetical protein